MVMGSWSAGAQVAACLMKRSRLVPLIFKSKLKRFAQKTPPEKWAAIKATFGLTFGASAEARERRHLYRLITGAHAPPSVLKAGEKIYIAFRPDSDVNFSRHPEITQ